MSATANTSQDEARRHATMRFAAGVTAAFVLCEAQQWLPSFLGPLFTVALLANLPVRPTLKMSLGLVITMTLAAFFAYALAALFRGTPTVLFGTLALTMFLGFHAIASGRPSLPFILLLICVATIPVIVMIAPAQAEAFPKSMVRGMAVAVLMIGIVYLPWPHAPVPAPCACAGSTASRHRAGGTGAGLHRRRDALDAGLSDVGTGGRVAGDHHDDPPRHHLRRAAWSSAGDGDDPRKSRRWRARAASCTPCCWLRRTCWCLAALLFVVLLGFGQRIFSGGPTAPVAVITCNSMLIILSLTIVSEGASLSVWLTRLFQFTLAGAFAVGMMSLISPRTSVQPATQ